MVRLPGLLVKKLFEAIKARSVARKFSSTVPGRTIGLDEPLLPSDAIMRYLYTPGELQGGRLRATDPMWSLTTHTVRNVVQRGGQPALYYLNSEPARGFVREELLIVPHGTELPPDKVLMRARPQRTR